jgi:hypothetical protein
LATNAVRLAGHDNKLVLLDAGRAVGAAAKTGACDRLTASGGVQKDKPEVRRK